MIHFHFCACRFQSQLMLPMIPSNSTPKGSTMREDVRMNPWIMVFSLSAMELKMERITGLLRTLGVSLGVRTDTLKWQETERTTVELLVQPVTPWFKNLGFF